MENLDVDRITNHMIQSGLLSIDDSETLEVGPS